MRGLLAAGAVCAVAGLAAGQNAMPGQEVGTGFQLKPVGQTTAKVGRPVGPAPGGAMTKPYDPTKPYEPLKQAGLDPNLVVAPLGPAPPLPSGAQPDLIDKLYAKIGTAFGLFPRPAPPPPTNPTPGIFRRNRERAEKQRAATWRRD
ncbi:MAG: hypothetical protein K2X82_07790 [Gemmataceae bacterium]|nr:hypothetical protein [Gemmataceae bacterium]